MNFNNIGKSTPYFNIYKSLDGISRSAKPNKFVLRSAYPYLCGKLLYFISIVWELIS